MKITKRGTLPGSRIWEATCWKCKTEVEAEERELETHEDQREGWWAVAPCPVCLTQMTFKRTERTAEPPAPRTCVRCGRPENDHHVRHPFVALSGGGA